LDDKLRGRAREIVENLERDGLAFIVEISADPDEAREALGFAMQHKNVYCTIGVHPNCADKYDENFEDWAIKQTSKKIVAVGECGLDYHHKVVEVARQKHAFIAQIKLADKLGLPLVVHMRDSFDDTFDILKTHKAFLTNGVLIHCFSGGAEEVRGLIELGEKHLGGAIPYFAFGGAVTYKNNRVSADAIRCVPRDRILLETDCPYLCPEPHRGGVNEPKNVVFVADFVARVLGVTREEVARVTTENAKRFYRLD